MTPSSSSSLSQSQKKPVIAVDVDEVLCPFLFNLVAHYNSIHDGVKSCHFSQFKSFHFADTWGCSNEESDEIVTSFFESKHFLEMEPLPEAREVLVQLKEHYELKIVTSRQHHLEEVTHKFLDTHFEGIFSDVKLGNHYGKTSTKKSKPEMMKEINAEILIDDSLYYAKDCVRNGLKSILFGDYPWNDAHPTFLEGRGIKRAKQWKDIPDLLKEMLHREPDERG